MFRTSMFLMIVLAIAATGSITGPASASSPQVFGARNEQVFAHYRPVTSVQRSYLHPPSKKKPG